MDYPQVLDALPIEVHNAANLGLSFGNLGRRGCDHAFHGGVLMSPTGLWIFEPFRVDPANACLWRGDQMILLRPKVFAVLALLVAHAGQLVTKEALFKAVWPET